MKNYILFLDGFVWFTVYLFVSMFSLYFASYVKNGSLMLAGISTGVFFFIRALTDLISPKLAKDTHKKDVLRKVVLGITFMPISYLVVLIGNYLLTSLIAIILLALSLGIYNPAKYTLYSVLNTGINEIRWGILDSIGLFTVSAAGLSSGLLVSFWGFRTLFFTGLVVSTLTLLISIVLQRKYASEF